MSEEVLNGTISPDQAELLLKEIPKDLLESGVFYGRRKKMSHPRAQSYVLTNRNGIEVINPLKIVETLEPALNFIKQVSAENGFLLFVGTQTIIEKEILKVAEELGMPHVTKRWLGGTLTNYKVISKRVEYYLKLKKDLASNALSNYTKKERLDFEKEANRLEGFVSGLEKLTKMPNALIVVDPKEHITAVREAKIMKIPVVALTNIDFNPELIDYPIVGNTKSRKSISWFLEKIVVAYREGVALRKVDAHSENAPTEQKKEVN